ncbi:MAG: nitrous oxide reductase family maturation protein NosD [Candidatus Thorarchaeota archaeon]
MPTKHTEESKNGEILYISNINDSPIEIFNDNDFLSYNFSGSGTQEDPYRIENLNIVTTNNYGIVVQNITKYILIQNNMFTDAFWGAIRIDNTSSGTIIIINNTCIGGDLGIIVSNSPQIKILNNTCSDSYNGININDSPHSLIENNTLTKNHVGIRVEHNIASSKISNNHIINNFDGVWITNSRSIIFRNNIIRNNVNGFLLDSINEEYASQNCVISNNLFENNTSFALILTAFLEQGFTRQNLVYHNSFVNNNPKGQSQAKDVGSHNKWYNESLREGNYWSDWLGFFPYDIAGSANTKDMYPLEAPLHSIITKVPTFFIGRVALVISLSIGIPVLLAISILIVKKFKKRNLERMERRNEIG